MGVSMIQKRVPGPVEGDVRKSGAAFRTAKGSSEPGHGKGNRGTSRDAAKKDDLPPIALILRLAKSMEDVEALTNRP